MSGKPCGCIPGEACAWCLRGQGSAVDASEVAEGVEVPDGANGDADGARSDPVNHPNHYTSSPATCSQCGAGIECIQITEHMGFSLGNAFKYVWRADLKHDAIEDLRKAVWYIEREIQKRERA